MCILAAIYVPIMSRCALERPVLWLLDKGTPSWGATASNNMTPPSFPAAARNVPVERRSTAVGIVTAASYAGTAIAFGLSPAIISRFGWPWIFYLFGGAALLWLPFWFPAKVQKDLHLPAAAGVGKMLGQEEQQPLLAGDGSSATAVAELDEEMVAVAAAVAVDGSSSSTAAAVAVGGCKGVAQEVGLQALLRRREVWAICATQYCQSYGMYGLLTWLPTFFSDYYKVEVGDLGGYTLLPYLMQVSNWSGGGGCGRGQKEARGVGGDGGVGGGVRGRRGWVGDVEVRAIGGKGRGSTKAGAWVVSSRCLAGGGGEP